MKLTLHKILAVCLAVVVLLTTTSFTINMHYCGGNLVETAMFKKAQGCGMEMQTTPFDTCSISKENCCDDIAFVAEGQTELQQSSLNFTYKQFVFITSFIYSSIDLYEGVEKENSNFKNYKPPLVDRQIYKLNETYII